MKAKVIGGVIIALIISAVIWGIPESIQKMLYDKKADFAGTDRVVTVYSPFHVEPLRRFADPDMRYDADVTGYTLWLGSINRKVGISPAAIVIVEDVIE